jgi:hypothetical protein
MRGKGWRCGVTDVLGLSDGHGVGDAADSDKHEGNVLELHVDGLDKARSV